jgi:hypothetical protein
MHIYYVMFPEHTILSRDITLSGNQGLSPAVGSDMIHTHSPKSVKFPLLIAEWVDCLLDAMHISYIICAEYSCLRNCHVGSGNNLQIHEKFSSNRFHFRQQENMQSTSEKCIHSTQLWFTNSKTQIVKQDLILWIGACLVCNIQKEMPHSSCTVVRIAFNSVRTWNCRTEGTDLQNIACYSIQSCYMTL